MKALMNGHRNRITNMKYNYLVVGALVAVTLATGAFLSATRVSADETKVTRTASVTVPDACMMTGTGMNSHTAEIANGNYVSEIGSTTFKITCNDGGGFSVYAIGFTGDEYEGEDHTKLIGASTGQKIATGTATGAGSSDVSNWAMKVGTDSSATYPLTLDNSFGSYHAVPDTYTKVAYRTSGTDSGLSATGSELTTTYAAYVSRTQSADTYDGKVKYTLVHPATETPLQPQTTQAGKICYYPNGGGVAGTMGCQNVSSSVTLLASNFSRSGYGFAGWSDKFDYSAGANFYGPNETITLNTADYSTTGLSLYAVWVKSVGSIQDSNKVASTCSSLTTAPTDGTANLRSITAFTDQRDNNTYAIAKLADGNCWMIENLRLEAEDTRGDAKKALAQGYGTSGTYGNFSGLADAEDTGFSTTYTPNSLYYSGTQEGSASIDIGTTNYPGYRMPRYNHTNTSARATTPTANIGAMYSYGNYYTWAAAIADTTYYNTNNQSITNTSLCPSGWHLPKGGNKSNEANNEFWALVVNGINGGTKPANYDSSTYPYYNGTAEAGPVADKLRAFPNNFLYSGYFYTSSAYGRGSYGYYWSSTAGGNYDSYYLYLLSSLVYPGSNLNLKNFGSSVRCVAPGL